MDEALVNLEDFQDVLNELKTVKYEVEMTPEMEASQKRYEEYIKKNTTE